MRSNQGRPQSGRRRRDQRSRGSGPRAARRESSCGGTCGCSTRVASSPRRSRQATGHFRFFAADGNWTLRTLAPGTKTVDRAVVAARGSVMRSTLTSRLPDAELRASEIARRRAEAERARRSFLCERRRSRRIPRAIRARATEGDVTLVGPHRNVSRRPAQRYREGLYPGVRQRAHASLDGRG